MVNMYYIIQLFTIEINLKHYTHYIDILDLPNIATKRHPNNLDIFTNKENFPQAILLQSYDMSI